MNIDIENFEEKGFALIKDFISNSDFAEFYSELNSLILNLSEKFNINLNSSDPISSIFLHSKSLRKTFYSSISNMVFIEEFKLRFFKFIKAEGVLSKYNIKNPAIRASLMFFLPNEDVFNNPVHQDIYAYTSEKFLKFWIPFTTVDEFHGTMQVFDGSHKKGFIPPDDYSNNAYPTFSDKTLKKFTSNKTVLNFSLGSILMFNPLLLHSTVTNRSSKTRITLGLDILDLATIVDLDSKNSVYKEMERIRILRSSNRSQLASY